MRDDQGALPRQGGSGIASVFAAFQFLTIFPPVIRRPFTERELGWSLASYPLVGLALGGVLLGAYQVLTRWFDPLVVAALVLVLWVLLTRALHLDGLMDTTDGLFGGWTPERRLEIMRDHQVGAFGVVAGALLLLVKFVLLVANGGNFMPLLLAPLIGRWVLVLAVVEFPYARNQGKGKTIKDYSNWIHLVIASLLALVAVWLIAGWWGMVVFSAVVLFVLLAAWFVQRRIPGLTGDIYGALCELSEVLVLLLFSAMI
ncbi:MAG: adenosylcobinamide-GDP ribazoletransferase [Anaerolineales bacterium]|nr:adenosylcobinamide-GDP ribazoletransferase [Anaerolineales bacterium]